MKKILALLLALLCLCSLFVACKKDNPDNQTPNNPENGNANPEENKTPTLDTSLEMRVWTLNGTTGFGMAQLMQQKTDGKAALNYKFTVETNATNVRDAVIAGTADSAAVPTNVASALYTATGGGVKVLALNTAGVLYLVTKDENVKSLADLAGKTVFCPAQNPTFIADALIKKSGVTDIVLDSTTYADPTDLRTAVASGEVDYAILPEPMVTIAVNAAAKAGLSLYVPIDLTAEWNKYFTEGSLVQGCVIVRSAFLAAHPGEVAKFLEEYKASVEYVIANPAEAADMIVAAGIFAQAPVAKQAIPKCNLCFVTGAQMKTRLAAFLAAMPVKSIGGALPADDFYYGA